MMSDLSKFESMYKQAFIRFEVKQASNKIKLQYPNVEFILKVYPEQPRMVGYSGFYFEHHFDKDEDLVQVAAWE